jgi:Domain of unknown function (DUF1772)
MGAVLAKVTTVGATGAIAILPALTGRRRFAHATASMTSALTMGLSFAHTLEIPGKLSYDGRLWWHLQRTLYRPWWGRAGYLEGTAILSTGALAYARREDHPALAPTAVAAVALLIANPGVFFALVAPANRATLHTEPDDLPADWRRLRNRWELGHALRFVLHLTAFVALRTAEGAGHTAAAPARRRHPTAVRAIRPRRRRHLLTRDARAAWAAAPLRRS